MFGNLGSMLGNMMGGASKEGGPGGMMGMVMNLMGGPDGIKKMIFEKLDDPEAIKMAEEKLSEILEFWAKKFNCPKTEVSFFWKIYAIPEKDENDNIKLGQDGKAITLDKFYVIVYVGNEAKEKYTLEQLVTLIKQHLNEAEPGAATGPTGDPKQLPGNGLN